MKKTDIAMIVLIVALSAGVAYFIASKAFGGMTQKGVTVKTVDPISSEVQTPDPAFFNENAINPSVEVNISNNGGTSTGTN